MCVMENKNNQIILQFIQDVSAGNVRPYVYYAEFFSTTTVAVRSVIRNFCRNYESRGKLPGGADIPSHMAEAAKLTYDFVQARNSPARLNSIRKDLPLPYDGVRPRRVWDAQRKGGEIVTMHSYEYSDELNDLQVFRQKVLEEIVDRYAKMVTTQVPDWRPKRTGKNLEPVGLMLYTADKHVGACSKRSAFGADWNAGPFRDRLFKTLDTVAMVHQMMGQLDCVRVVDLGDGLDGPSNKTTRGGHYLHQNMDGHDQFDTYLHAHIEYFDTLVSMGVAQAIELVVTANDNHGGFAMYAAARALEVYLTTKYPGIKTIVSRDFYVQAPYGMHRFVYAHGKDDVFMSKGMPLKLDPDTTKKIEEYIDFNGLGKHLDFSQERACLHFIKADLHQSAEEFARRFRYKHVMSMYGASPYVEHNYGMGYSGHEYEIVFKNRPHLIGGRAFTTKS